MIDQDYTDFSNFAYRLRGLVERHFATMSDDFISQLNGHVRHELSFTPNGKVEPAYDFLAAMLAEEADERRKPKTSVEAERKVHDGAPF